MKKYKLIVQIEKIKKYLEQGKLQEACHLADEVDPKKLKSMSDLSIIAECYFQNKRYLEAKELFEQIYDTIKTRRILAQLVHLSIKLNDIIEANYYLEEFLKIAPEDFYQHIFRYSIDKMMKKPLEVLIKDLENLREVEYIESWAYELAKLYFKSGNEVACRKECEKIILWFGSGEYVERAKALLAYYDGELDVKTILNAAHKKVSVPEEKEDGKAQEAMEEEEDREELERSFIEEKEELKVSESSKQISKHALFHKKYASIPEEMSESIAAEAVSYEGEPYLNPALEEELTEGSKQKSKEELTEESKQELKQETTEELTEELIEESTEALIKESTDESKEVGKKETELREIELTETEIKKTEIKKAEIKESEEYNKLQESDKTEEFNENNSDIDNALQNTPLEADEKIQEFYEIEVKSNHEYIPHLHSALWPCLEDKEIQLEEIFGNFIRLNSFSEIMIDSLEKMVHSVYGQHNLVLMGSKDSGQIDLAKKYAKLFHKLSLTGSPRVALIDALKLNHMDLMGKRTQLKDCIVILQNAEELTRDTLIRLMELQQLPRQNIFYILTGQTDGINQLFHENEELTNTYPIRISIPKYELEDYCGFVYDTITDAGYKIEKEAFSLVRIQIQEIMKIKRENSFSEVLSYIKQIIQKHEKQNEQILLDLTRAGALEQFDLSVLRKEDIG